MSIYFPEADVAVEVIPEPAGLPPAALDADVARIYVSEGQATDDAFVAFLSEIIHDRETRLGHKRRRAHDGSRREQGPDNDEAHVGAPAPQKRPASPAAGTDAARDVRDAEELMEDLLDAQDELAAALADLTGELLVSSPEDEGDPADQAGDEEYDPYEELGCYEYWLQDWLDDLCSARTRSMRRPTREINIGNCKNLYLSA
jgi:hypothetical protein